MSSKRSLHRRANEHTLIWLEANYELREGICLPRCLLYHHYIDYMRKRGGKPIGAAAFGKLVRQKFPKITTRRLGTRGQSKYHYYGVGIKLSSIYYQDQRPSGSSNKTSKHSGVKRGLKRRPGKMSRVTKLASQMPHINGSTNLLRHFPRTSEFIIPADVQREKLSTFLIMYRTHCQRIIDTFITARGEEIERYLNHFWNEIPTHLTDLLENQFMINVIECADSILYTAIEDALAPKSLHEFRDQFNIEIKNIMNNMPQWIKCAMKIIPHHLMNKKLEVFQQFSSAIRRQLSFMQLAKSCKLVLCQQENVPLMCRDMESIDTYEIWSQMCTLCPGQQVDLIYGSFRDLMSIMKRGLNIEHLTDWVNSIVDKYVVNGKCSCLTSRASQLVFALGTFLSGIIRDLTLNNAKTFGFWHLVFITLEEYVLLIVSRSVRYESQSVRRLTIMKQPLNTVTSYSDEGTNHIQDQQRYDDMNLLMTIAYMPWQECDESSSSYSYNEHYEWPISSSMMTSNNHVNNNTMISNNGNTYTCLS